MASTPAPQKRGFRFVGDGSRFIPGVPARDLTPEEADRFADAIRGSDLYQPEAASASAATEKADDSKGDMS